MFYLRQTFVDIIFTSEITEHVFNSISGLPMIGDLDSFIGEKGIKTIEDSDVRIS